jgi:hypothetical protein
LVSTGVRRLAQIGSMLSWGTFAVTGACTLLSDFDVDQCETDAACENPVGVTRYCDSGRCVMGCRNNHHCASLDPSTPLCNRDQAECVSITSARRECYLSSDYDDQSLGEASVQSMNIVGAFASTLHSSTWLTLDLAVDELQSPMADEDSDAWPPLMVVVCQDGPDDIGGGVAHLVDNLGVRGVIASFDGSAQAAALLAAGEGALLLSPEGVLDDTGGELYWYLGGDYRTLTPVYPRLLAGLARHVGERVAGTGRLSRVAVISGPGEHESLAGLAAEALVVDGQTRGELEVNDRFRSFPLSDDQRERDLAALLEFAPDLVILQVGGVFNSAPRAERATVIGQLEEAAAAGTRPLPIYLIGPRSGGDSYLDALAATSASFRARALMIDLTIPSEPEEAALRARFANAYPNSAPDVRPVPRIYDALYYLAYASVAGRDELESSPTSIRMGLQRVTDPSGPLVHVGTGPQGLDVGRQLALAKRPFALEGLTGSGAFLPDRQVRAAPPIISCWGDDGTRVVIGSYASESGAMSLSTGSCAGEAVDAAFN